MIKDQIKNGIIFGLSTFFTIFVCIVGYASITNVWTNTDTLEVSSGSTLSATSWNKLLGNFEFLKSRTEGIYSSAGKIGIGTDSPEQTLHLKTSGTSAQLVLERYNTSVGKMAIGADNYGFNIYDTPSYTRRLTVTSSGNLGIGIINPSEKLDLGGGNIKMGYEIVENFLPIGDTNTGRIYVNCPSGKKVLGGTCTSSNGSLGVETAVSDTRYACYKYNTTNSWTVKAICANIR